jgi:ribosome-associated protein
MIVNSEKFAELSTQLALSKKAEDIILMDVRQLTSVADFFVICSGNSDTQIKAIADAIIEGLEKENVNIWHVEGYSHLKWVLLDFVDFVVHVFHKDTREFYSLERLWGDASIRLIEAN